jgi:hypothetical protein
MKAFCVCFVLNISNDYKEPEKGKGNVNVLHVCHVSKNTAQKDELLRMESGVSVKT